MPEADANPFQEDDIRDAVTSAVELSKIAEAKTVDTLESIDEEEFFTDDDGNTTITNRYDLEKAVPAERKRHIEEIERYWVNKPYAFVSIFHSHKENEKKYYLIEPHMNQMEWEVREFLGQKLRTSIRYQDDEIRNQTSNDERLETIEEKTKELIRRYDYYQPKSFLESVKDMVGDGESSDPFSGTRGITARPDEAEETEGSDHLSPYQIEKLLYYIKRDFLGYERIDGITYDVNVEDISCDGYNSPVFVYHSEYEQLISNIEHGEQELDDFVVNLAQRSGKGISKRKPQVDATLPNGSRAQLTLGKEVSDHGTNYTIRQFKEVPFTPIDLINWNTFSLNQMAFLWLAIENGRSLMFAGGTASGKTTSLNAVSLFIPSNSKIVSIEDTREVELPQRNWIASVTRPSFTGDDQGSVDEFDLLEGALRQRPDYIVFGEVRGEEGRTLFQVMSTGHTTYTTFHADSVGEVLKRFTTDPINVSKTLFTSLDLVSIQTQTRVNGNKVRRNKVITEINSYDTEDDEINVQDVYEWNADHDRFEGFEESRGVEDVNTLQEIKFDRGWDDDEIRDQLRKRRLVLAYLQYKGLNTYTEVAATIQAYINDPDTILALIANEELETQLENLRDMENVLIQVSEEDEENAPRPDATEEQRDNAKGIIERNSDILDQYRGKEVGSLRESLPSTEAAESVTAMPVEEYEFLDEDIVEQPGEPNINRDELDNEEEPSDEE